ncbi:hypothetical protein M8J76_005564 [Diaphorina citri]|nr:hypothetical protein M8J76_005564 [Diaphorina citri]
MVHSEAVNNDIISDDNDFRLSSIINCFQEKFTDKCLRVKAIGAAKLWSSSVVATARDNKDLYQEDPREVGNLAQEIGELITYGISRFFHSEETDYPGDHGVDKVLNKTGRPDVSSNEEARGHKKKKIQKEIKKFFLKILFGIFIIKQKIKMLLMMIQTLLMSKFLIVATIYALSGTFKIWYDIKHHKHHHDNKVIYYENAHHQHHYEPDHPEYEDHHGWGGGIWGRSVPATESSDIIASNPIEHYARSLSHDFAFAKQRPAVQKS